MKFLEPLPVLLAIGAFFGLVMIKSAARSQPCAGCNEAKKNIAKEMDTCYNTSAECLPPNCPNRR